MNELSHVDDKGHVKMVDVSGKKNQLRIAKASGKIKVSASTIELIAKEKIKKGNVLTTAELAGIQTAKRTSEIIPLCHNLPLSKVDVKAKLDDDGVLITCEVICVGQTGVEMEALVAVSVALLTVYDMCKAVDKDMVINSVSLVEKTKSDI
jgi:cyclic pyranopterin phosphate synthase